MSITSLASCNTCYIRYMREQMSHAGGRLQVHARHAVYLLDGDERRHEDNRHGTIAFTAQFCSKAANRTGADAVALQNDASGRKSQGVDGEVVSAPQVHIHSHGIALRLIGGPVTGVLYNDVRHLQLSGSASSCGMARRQALGVAVHIDDEAWVQNAGRLVGGHPKDRQAVAIIAEHRTYAVKRVCFMERHAVMAAAAVGCAVATATTHEIEELL
jgi:hypothetical protein